MFAFLPAALRLLITSVLWTTQDPPDAAPATLRFHLRHEHAVSTSARVIFADSPALFAPEAYDIPVRTISAARPQSPAAFAGARTASMRHMQSTLLPWGEVDVVGPDTEKRATLLLLAKMAANAYYETSDKRWYPLDAGWNVSYPFGWEPDADGFRGHIFATEDNSTVVVSIKGTSAGWIAGDSGPTVKKDKLNDNLLFSCCCARVGPTWYTVCDCYSGGYKCDQTCVEQSLVEDSLFYSTGINLYNNVTYMYPNSEIWLIGHSLGGSLASLLGATFGAPVVAFQAPGERMAAARLHLPSPPSTHHITHVIHTSDPIAMGTCTGVTSLCALGGYALESRCHLGRVALYDTVSERGWAVDTRTHGISVVVEKLLAEDWDPEHGREVPVAAPEVDCVDCFNWEYGEFKNATKKAVHGR